MKTYSKSEARLPSFFRIGHRGAAGHALENTLSSFEAAFSLGANAVEFDIHLTQNGELVVIHDETLDRTTKGYGAVSDFTLSQLQTIPTLNGDTIPTLKHVMIFLNQKWRLRPFLANIELKGRGTGAGFAAFFKRGALSDWDARQLLLSSFSRDELLAVYKELPFLKLGVLLETLEKDWLAFASSISAFSINVSKDILSPSLIKSAHKNGFKLMVFTVNDEKEILQYIQWGVDGVFSDYPERIPFPKV